MPDNLIQPGTFYYHPLTRIPPKPHKMFIDGRTGELVDEPQEAPKLAFRVSLTPAEVVQHYYDSVGTATHAHMNRDSGAVKHLVRTFGLDKTLFAIEALINDHMDGEERGHNASDLIKASDYMAEAEDRIGEVAVVARQYQVDHV